MTVAQIVEAANIALGVNDKGALERYIAELDAIGTPEAQASASIYRGSLSHDRGEFLEALEHYKRAVSINSALGNNGSAGRATLNIGLVYNSIGDQKASMEHLKHALDISIEVNDLRGQALALCNLGVVSADLGDHRAALEFYHRSIEIYDQLQDSNAMAYPLGNIGNVHMQTGNYPAALDHFHRALAIHVEHHDMASVALGTGNIGSVYASTGDYASALEHHRRALALHEELGEHIRIASHLNNIGTALAKSGNLQGALENLHQALTTYEAHGVPQGVALVLGNLIELYLLMDRDADAQAHLDAMDAMHIDDPSVRVIREHRRGALLERRGDLDLAHETYGRALAEAIEYELRPDIVTTHLLLRDLSLKRNDFASYVEHNNEYARIAEEIRGKETTHRMAMMQAERSIEAERREREKERALLHGTLPRSIADRMIRGEKVTGDHYDHAAVLFIDVVDFTSHTADMPPAEVVQLLDGMFNAFDAICSTHDVIKIKTIGDSYMCFRGDADATTNATSIATAARNVMHEAFAWPNGTPIRFRAGIHIGPATAGVIGTQRLQYDVWGDTINVASRMESTGEPGRIHVSDTFAQHLTADSLTLIPRGVVDVKGKGAMSTFWLEDVSA